MHMCSFANSRIRKQLGKLSQRYKRCPQANYVVKRISAMPGAVYAPKTPRSRQACASYTHVAHVAFMYYPQIIVQVLPPNERDAR